MSTENGTTDATLAGTAEANTTFESKGKGKAPAESEDHPMGEAEDDEDDEDEDETEVSLAIRALPALLRVPSCALHVLTIPFAGARSWYVNCL